MKHAIVLDRTVRSAQAARAPKESETALNVVVVYQDPLTRHWAEELWDRMGRLIDSGGVCHKCWKIVDLTEPDVFADSVHAATEAQVLVVSVRDDGPVPVSLRVWIDTWLPKRMGPPGGAFVALIGMAAQPDAQSGGAYKYLESVANRAGMDFLPTERKLARETFVPPALPGIRPPATSRLASLEEHPAKARCLSSRRGISA